MNLPSAAERSAACAKQATDAVAGPDDRCGSKPEELSMSRRSQLYPLKVDMRADMHRLRLRPIAEVVADALYSFDRSGSTRLSPAINSPQSVCG